MSTTHPDTVEILSPSERVMWRATSLFEDSADDEDAIAELVLRFFALRHAEHYRRGMRGFLDIYARDYILQTAAKPMWVTERITPQIAIMQSDEVDLVVRDRVLLNQGLSWTVGKIEEMQLDGIPIARCHFSKYLEVGVRFAQKFRGDPVVYRFPKKPRHIATAALESRFS